MKKERLILFPGNEGINASFGKEHEIHLKDLLPGNSYRIGKPSNMYYQYIYPAIVPDELNGEEFDDFKSIQGFIVKITSIIQMANGKRIVAMRESRDKLFLNRFEKIFAQVDMAIASREIISLNLGAERTLEPITNSNPKLKA